MDEWTRLWYHSGRGACNLSEGIERKGIEKGRTDDLRNLIKNTGWTLERGMDALGILPGERASYAKLLGKR